MYNSRRDQRAKNPHGFLGPGSQHPSVLQHPASSIHPTHTPALRDTGQDRVGSCEMGGLTSAAQQCLMRPGDWAPRNPFWPLSRTLSSGIGFWVGGNTARGEGRGVRSVVTGGPVLKPFTDQASLWAAQPLSR